MAKLVSIFVCQTCGAKAPKWQGKCNECGAWNSLVEEVVEKGGKSAPGPSSSRASRGEQFGVAKKFSDYTGGDGKSFVRISSGYTEFNRVLGGGFVPGSLLLFGGEPGIGKSTLLLQVLGQVAKLGHRVLYISAEESGPQVGSRAQRLKIADGENLQFLPTTDLDEALEAIQSGKPELVVVDSVQTIAKAGLDSAPGTVSQVRDVTQALMDVAKSKGTIILLVGHVTKEGSIAGPRLLEHMVDGVFYFEMATTGGYRMLRGQKNRFGGTHELAVFEMTGSGMTQVENPSQRFLAERCAEMPGSSVIAHLEGSRPFLTEFQALTQKCFHGYPRRTVQGVDQNRISVLLAVIERHLRLNMNDQDVYCKVASGAEISEPAADLPMLFALVSALTQKTIPSDTLLLGEVGLGGEIRSVSGIGARLAEGKTVGLSKAVIPAWNLKEAKEIKGVQLIPVKNVREAMRVLELGAAPSAQEFGYEA